MKAKTLMRILTSVALVCLMAKSIYGAEKLKKDKLQIIFMFGQSNMVGMPDVRTAWYLTQPQYIPNRENALKKSDNPEWDWDGVQRFDGPQELKDAFDAAVKQAGLPGGNDPKVEASRAAYANLAQTHVKLPIARRTYLSGFGAIAGSKGEGITSETSGPLSVGYGADIDKIGPEYAVGITLEHLVDAPILLVKCAWGNTTINEAWRPGSLDGIETPKEKAAREEWNSKEQAAAKAEGREPKLRPEPKPTGKLSWAWNMVIPHVKKVLADPGKFHPEYDAEAGSEIAGMVWFQGYSDAGNKAYGEQLVEMIKWFRKEVNAPDMPVVAGTMGVGGHNHKAYEGEVNNGMVYASQVPELKGKVDVVNTARYFPSELGLLINDLNACEKYSPEYNKIRAIHLRANSNKAFHYYGSAKFFLLAGDAMARSLANLMAGGEPTVHKEIVADNAGDESEDGEE